MLQTLALFAQDKMNIADAKHCLIDAQCHDTRNAAYTLAASHQFNLLITSAAAAAQRQADIVAGIYGSGDGRKNKDVVSFIREASKSMPYSDRFSDTSWYSLQFLADRCDHYALQRLTNGGASGEAGPLMQFEISSEEWATSLRSFGSCMYYPSRYVLIHSLNAANIDASYAAHKSLEKLFPGVCTSTHTPETTVACFERYFNKSLHR